ncbi:MAG: thioesterase family protein [Myxococcota bacterium]|nr:thioesterase family protein [Myxococcota bacterium]
MEHTERMRVQWVDTDASGLIHYTAALRYFEVPEHALMRRAFADAASERGFKMPRVHVEADYLAPLRYPDVFDCTVRVESVGTTSVTYGYRITREDGTECIRGRIVAVAIDAEGRSRPIPPAIRARLQA